MPTPIPKDNSTKTQKAQLRSKALITLETKLKVKPIVMETHGGFGKLFATCYAHIDQGIVIEKNPVKAERLLKQRGDRWCVYEGDTLPALRAGLGAHLAVNFLDVDPWGDPWPIIDAFLGSERPKPRELMIVVNDGLRQLVQRQGSWTTETLEAAVRKYGNQDLYRRYLEICKEMMTAKAGAKGYELWAWTGYYAGKNMTHYAALLLKSNHSLLVKPSVHSDELKPVTPAPPPIDA